MVVLGFEHEISRALVVDDDAFQLVTLLEHGLTQDAGVLSRRLIVRHLALSANPPRWDDQSAERQAQLKAELIAIYRRLRAELPLPFGSILWM